MAIEKMKKLRLIAVRSKKDALLRELVCLGCVEFSELEDTLQGSEAEGLLNRQSSNLTTYRAQLGTLSHALSLLDKYAPVKGKLLTAKPEVEEAVLLDDSTVAGALKFATAIGTADERIRRISADESRQRGIVEALQPWLELELPLNTEGTARTSVLMGTFPGKLSLDRVDEELELVSQEAEIFRINEDQSAHYVLAVCMKEELPAVQECLRAQGFTPSALSNMNGSARKCLGDAESALSALALDKERCIKVIADETVRRDEIKLAADRVSTKIALAEAEEKLYGTQSVVLMEGWMPEENQTELEQVFEKYDCAWETSDPTEDEYPSVPVKLKNNKLTNALNMVTEMYSLPAYGSLDPNPLMAPFFILFYGLMMADMGYGILMIAAALVAMKRIKPREGAMSFCQLLLYGGISTFIMGAVTGGFFGNCLEEIGKIIGKPEGWGVLPSLFSPMKDVMLVLVGAMVLGVIHLNTGMVINFVKKTKRGQLADAIWEEGMLWVTLVGIVLAVLKIGNVAGIPVVLVAGVLGVFYGGSRNAKGMGKLLSIFATLYNTATGWFGDILSYSRIMALMLAGSVIATVFNTIGAIANNLIFFFIIFFIGQTLNFALNLLGCYVHDLRLQCLEFFGKFYEDGGKAFNPLRIKTKYFDVAE